MAFVNEETAAAYREAWDAWRKQVDHLHRFFFEGEKLGPDQVKGLLNREARAKEKYDAARRKLLGIEVGTEAPGASGGNPFR